MTIQDLLYAVLPRLTQSSGVDIIQATNAALRSIGKRLAVRRSDLIRAPLSITCRSQSASLPARFIGFSENPTVVIGISRRSLTPLNQEERISLDRSGTPERYELVGSRLYLFPYPTELVTVKGMAYQLPEILTELDDELPWNGMFDDLLAEAVFRISTIGINHASEQSFEFYLAQEVDNLLPLRSSRPKRAKSFHF